MDATSKRSHTPGPWMVTDYATNRHTIETENHWPVAEVFASGVRAPDGNENEANACLIANAPALLEALKDLVARFPAGEYEGAFSKTAREVIARAEGRAE